MSTASLDRAFEALASAPRRELVARVARGPVTTPEVGRHFGITRQALNRHVTVLEHAGLVHRTRRGRVQELRLAPGQFDRVQRWIDQIQSVLETNLDRLGDALGELDD